MQAVRREQTAPEQRITAALKALGIPFRKNQKQLLGKPDLYFPQIRLVVFVHGCFWHGHGGCPKGRKRPKTRTKYWESRIANNQRRDKRVAQKLRLQGLRVYTVWECEVSRNGIPARLCRRLYLS
jgi:DNA mismatch endonuclease (patch repair protein)